MVPVDGRESTTTVLLDRVDRAKKAANDVLHQPTNSMLFQGLQCGLKSPLRTNWQASENCLAVLHQPTNSMLFQGL